MYISSSANSSYKRQLGFLNPSKRSFGDQYFDKVVLFLKGDGTNGSTQIIDSSPIPKVISVNGNASISTAQSKYGGSSLFSSTTGYITASNPSLNLSGVPFTIELWIYLSAITASDYCTSRSGSTTGGWLLYNGAFYFEQDGWVPRNMGMVTNTWQHIACSYDGVQAKLFNNGILKHSLSFGYTSTQSSVTLFAGNGGTNQTDNIYIDHFKITKQISKYSENFDPELEFYA